MFVTYKYFDVWKIAILIENLKIGFSSCLQHLIVGSISEKFWYDKTDIWYDGQKYYETVEHVQQIYDFVKHCRVH